MKKRSPLWCPPCYESMWDAVGRDRSAEEGGAEDGGQSRGRPRGSGGVVDREERRIQFKNGRRTPKVLFLSLPWYMIHMVRFQCYYCERMVVSSVDGPFRSRWHDTRLTSEKKQEESSSSTCTKSKEMPPTISTNAQKLTTVTNILLSQS